MAALFKGKDPPCKDPKNYTLSDQKITVSYKDLSSAYDHESKELKLGAMAYDTVRKAIGKCLYIGFKKGMDGKRCTIQGNRRNSHSDINNCIPVPNLFAHVQKSNKWYEVVEMSDKVNAVVVPVMVMEPEELDVADLFEPEEDDGEAEGNAAGNDDSGVHSDDSTRATRADHNDSNATPNLDAGDSTTDEDVQHLPRPPTAETRSESNYVPRASTTGQCLRACLRLACMF